MAYLYFLLFISEVTMKELGEYLTEGKEMAEVGNALQDELRKIIFDL